MALGERNTHGSDHQHCETLEDHANDVHAMLFHFDPETKNIVPYRFAVDPRLSRPGVPDWVTHYPTFPKPVRKALEGLYALASRCEPYATER